MPTTITGSMERAMAETDRRREKQTRLQRRATASRRRASSKSIGDIMSLGLRAATTSPSTTGLAEDGAPHRPQSQGARIADLEKRMRDAAADLEFEEAARLRDEIKRLEQMELAIADDPLARNPGEGEERVRNAPAVVARGQPAPSGEGRGPAGARARTRLDEMTVRRTEVPLGAAPAQADLDYDGPRHRHRDPAAVPPAQAEPRRDARHRGGPAHARREERPRGRSIAGRPGSDVGKGGRR